MSSLRLVGQFNRLTRNYTRISSGECSTFNIYLKSLSIYISLYNKIGSFMFWIMKQSLYLLLIRSIEVLDFDLKIHSVSQTYITNIKMSNVHFVYVTPLDILFYSVIHSTTMDDQNNGYSDDDHPGYQQIPED